MRLDEVSGESKGCLLSLGEHLGKVCVHVRTYELGLVENRSMPDALPAKCHCVDLQILRLS